VIGLIGLIINYLIGYSVFNSKVELQVSKKNI